MTGGFLRRARVEDVRRNAEEVLAFTGLDGKAELQRPGR